MNTNDVLMRSAYSPSGETGPGDQSSKDQNHPVESRTLTITKPHSEETLRAKSWWKISYRASLPAFLVLMALTWTQCDFARQENPDWKTVLALADAARERRDLFYAKHLYLQAGKFAVWRDDWAGLLAAACGTSRMLKKAR